MDKLRSAILVPSLALLYFVAARLGLTFGFHETNATPVWPPAGIALAAVLIFGYRAWPGIAFGAFLANFTTGLSIPISFFIACGNTLEAIGGVYLIRRFSQAKNPFDRTQDTVRFLAIAAVCTTISATIGSISLQIGGFTRGESFNYLWLTWWLGDTTGIIVFTFPIMTWLSKHVFQPSPPHLIQAISMILLLIAISAGVFSGFFPVNPALTYLTIPPLLLMALFLHQRSLSLAIFILLIFAIQGTSHRHGPFLTADPDQSFIFLQVFIAIVTFTSIILSATVAERERQRLQLETVVRHLPTGVVIAEAPTGKLILRNEQAESIWRSPFRETENIAAYNEYSGFHADGRPYKPEEWPLARSILTGETVRDEEIRFRRDDGTYGVMIVNSAPIRNETGRIVAAVVIFHDITAQKEFAQTIANQLEEKEALLREVHHRVKNNMQVISSLLNLQHSSVSLEVQEIFKEARNRIRSMALIHESLYSSDNFSAVDFSQYIKDLAGRLYSSYLTTGNQVSLSVESDDLTLNIERAVPCGLIVNELLSNALKHAFKERGKGKIIVRFSRSDGKYLLEVSDDGEGIPTHVDPTQSKESFGLRLVSLLVAQLDGKMQVEQIAGTHFRIEF